MKVSNVEYSRQEAMVNNFKSQTGVNKAEEFPNKLEVPMHVKFLQSFEERNDIKSMQMLLVGRTLENTHNAMVNGEFAIGAFKFKQKC